MEFFEAINLKKLVPGLPVDSLPRLLSVILFARKRMAKNAKKTKNIKLPMPTIKEKS